MKKLILSLLVIASILLIMHNKRLAHADAYFVIINGKPVSRETMQQYALRSITGGKSLTTTVKVNSVSEQTLQLLPIGRTVTYVETDRHMPRSLTVEKSVAGTLKPSMRVSFKPDHSCQITQKSGKTAHLEFKGNVSFPWSVWQSLVAERNRENNISLPKEFQVFDAWSGNVATVLINRIAEADNGSPRNSLLVNGTYSFASSQYQFAAWVDRDGWCKRLDYPKLHMTKVSVDWLSHFPGIIGKTSTVDNLSTADIANPRHTTVLCLRVIGSNVKTSMEEAGTFSRQDIVHTSANSIQFQLHNTGNATRDLNIYRTDLEMAGEKRFMIPTELADSDNIQIRACTQALLRKKNRTIIYDVRYLLDFVIDHFSQSLNHKRDVGCVSGSQCLQLDHGDCTEYSILFATLLRSVRVPCRVVAGLIYDSKTFSYHMWVQVRGRNGWVDVDPAYNQIGIDAAHLAVCSSDLSTSSMQKMQEKISQLLHQVRIETCTTIANSPSARKENI